MSRGPIVVRLPTTLLELVPGLGKEGLTLGIWTHFSGEKCPPGRFSEVSGAAGFEACNETGVAERTHTFLCALVTEDVGSTEFPIQRNSFHRIPRKQHQTFQEQNLRGL